MRPFYTFNDERVNDLRHVSHLEFYHVCQRIAHAVRPNRQGPDNAIVAIIANSDTILYQSLTLGVIYAGLIPFPMSPRNSSAAVVNMMRKTGCRRMIETRHSLGALLDGVRTEFASCVDEPIEIEIEEPPALAYAYPSSARKQRARPSYPIPGRTTRRRRDHVLSPLVGEHRVPKTHPDHLPDRRSLVHHAVRVRACRLPNRYPSLCSVAPAVPYPRMYYVQLYYPISSLKSVSVYAPTSYHDSTTPPVIPNPRNTIKTVRWTRSTALVLIPAFLEEWATSPRVVHPVFFFPICVFPSP
ncbi:hypothetical protein J3R82DRAFT_8606 [Butyriboletus roseoflavus]|nr:hypothetical protein J3R82DRAFT_8606 [Butyriboletus roseoflavus]